MTKNNPFDGYTINLYIDEDGDWLSHLEALPNVSAFGYTPEESLHELAIAWEGMKESYRKHDEPIPIAPSRKRRGHKQKPGRVGTSLSCPRGINHGLTVC